MNTQELTTAGEYTLPSQSIGEGPVGSSEVNATKIYEDVELPKTCDASSHSDTASHYIYRMDHGLPNQVTKRDVYKKDILYQLKIVEVEVAPDHLRKYQDPKELENLKSSIRKNGVLQPILFRTTPDCRLILVAGVRRYQAAKELGMVTIPGMLTDGDPDEIAIIENTQREDIIAYDEATAYKMLMEKHKHTQETLGLILGKSPSSISETMSLLRLPEIILKECRNSNIYPKRVLIEIAKNKSDGDMIKAFTDYVKLKLTYDEVKNNRKPEGKFDKAQKTINILNKALDTLKEENFPARDVKVFIISLQNLEIAIADFKKTIRESMKTAKVMKTEAANPGSVAINALGSADPNLQES